MSTFVVDDLTVTVPPDVVDLASFRRWSRSEAFPERGRACFFHGQVWVDMSPEQIFTHNQVKNEIAFVLTGLAKRRKSGRYYPDGVLLTNPEAELSCQLDGVFILHESLDHDRVRLIEGTQEGFVELEGSPDLVVEVVSRSSVVKDTETLPALYWKAGIAEYWLVDARGAKPQLTVHHAGTRGYVAARKQGGWAKSRVLDASFRIVRDQDERGDPEFRLDVKE